MFRRDRPVRVLSLSPTSTDGAHRAHRNGGHINPPLWQEWKSLKEHHGDAHARALIDFRLAHVHDLQRVAAREGVLAASQVRATEHLEVHFTQDTFDDACAQFDAWRADMPDAAREFEACGAVEAREVRTVSLSLCVGSMWWLAQDSHGYCSASTLQTA